MKGENWVREKDEVNNMCVFMFKFILLKILNFVREFIEFWILNYT